MPVKPVNAINVESVKGLSGYPPEFATQVAGRTKRKLGDIFGLTNFGVNFTDLDPGSASALYHHHETQDEFVYVVSGVATILLGDDQYELSAGECIGFPAGTGVGHQVVNRSEEIVSYLEVGDRNSDDKVEYPKDDIRATVGPDGSWIFTRKNGDSF